MEEVKHKRRVRYKGTHPRKFEEKYKELNPEKYADTNIEGANAFIEWICSDEIQAVIAEFGVAEYGEPLFTPNAGADA